jgi:hypothetical protein
MFSLGTQVNLVTTPLENMLGINKGSHLVGYLLVDYPIGKRLK